MHCMMTFNVWVGELNKLRLKLLLVLLLASVSTNSYAVFSTIEVGEATLPAFTITNTSVVTPFTRINFTAPFDVGVIPNVFSMTPEFGVNDDDDPCLIRIKNITNTGFDATCLEPRNEDRNSPGTTFEYIAIKSGTTTIPTTTGGSVVFESQCTLVDRQQYGNNCSNCSLNTGQQRAFQTVSFTNTYTNAPALLTELVSTNNLLSGTSVPSGEPEFLGVATTSLSNTSFGVAIERFEAGNGAIANSESICYLAVEQEGCQVLDLTGISGSVDSMQFEATSGGNVDGHDNGGSTGEGASFTAGCFSGTPVGVADKQTRNGGDGGFIRRESINANEIIVTIDEDRVSNSERGHIDELVSVLAFGQLFTTPVTINKVEIEQTGRRVKFNWETTAESFHLGFHLWGETSAGWEQLNKRLIAGQGRNTESKSEYSNKIRLSRQQYNEVQRFGISSVDTSGFEEFYGPFVSNQEYGQEDNSEAIDWADTRKQFEQGMRDQGFVQYRNRWRKNTKQLQRRIDRQTKRVQSTALDIRFDGIGMRKISVSEVLAKQPSWKNVALNSIAVTLNGNAVMRKIISDDGLFSDDDTIVINVIEPQARDQMYLNDYNYRLVLDPRKATEALNVDARNTDDLVRQEVVLLEHTLTQDQRYSRVITSGSPWYDARVLSRQAEASRVYNVSFNEELSDDQPGQLSFSLFGGIDLPGAVIDHHVQIRVNNTLVHDGIFDGFTEHRGTIELAPGLLTGSDDEVKIVLPGDTGLFADLVLIDELKIAIPVYLDSKQARNFQSNPIAKAYQVPISDEQVSKVFAYTESGAFSELIVTQSDNAISFRALAYLNSDNKADQLTYSVSRVDELESSVSIETTNTPELHKVTTDLLVVAHPNFLGQELDAYIAFKKEEGFNPLVLSWLDLVERYGFGNNTPDALNNFLGRAKNYYTLKNVLIVGGHTYDYLNVLGTGAVNFIPTHYRRVSSAEYAPADNVFADLDFDNLPEFAIGRWPVRTLDDLNAIIAKSQAWQIKRRSNNNQNALLIAQAKDGRNLNFEQSLEGRVVPQLSALSQFSEPVKVYLQNLPTDGLAEPIQHARELIAEAINSGTDLVSFAGHGSVSGWGFQGVVDTQFIKELENHNNPVIVMPLACYTSNYESLGTNSLAHQWLFAGTQGAAAVHGAAMLGEYRENGIFAERVLKHSRTVKSLGEAILQAKLQMSSANEMLHNWTLLGDPTLLLE